MKIFLRTWCLIVPVIFLVTSSANGQDRKKEIRRLLDAFQEVEFADTTSGRKFLDSSLLFGKELQDPFLLGEIYKNYGWFHQDWYRYYDAMTCFNLSLEFYELAGYRQGIADMHGNIGTVYADIGDFDKAIMSQQKSYAINERILLSASGPEALKKARSGKANALGNLGNIYTTMEDFEIALEYHKKSLELEEENNYASIAASYSNLGILYRRLKMYDEALECHNKAFEFYEKENSLHAFGRVYNNLALICLDKKEYDKAEAYIQKAIGYDIESENSFNLTYSYNNYAELLLRRLKPEDALKYAIQSMQISEQNGFVERRIYTNELLYRIYNKMKDYEKALFHHTQYVFYEDSLFSVKKETEMFRKSVLFDLEKDLIADSVSRARENEMVRLRHDQEIYQQRTYTFVGAGGFILMIIIALQLLRGNRRKQHTNKILADKNEIITLKSIETEKQKLLLQEKQKEIVDSINYAKRIQFALLAHDEFLREYLPEHFVLYEPKDIVSGDFYWATKKNEKFYLAVCDSTGHGVPGAFMSLLNTSFLNEAVNEKGILRPDEVLNYVRERLIQNIPDDAKDGMDAILVSMEKVNGSWEINYAAANNAPCVISGDSVKEYPADKMPVGKNLVMDPFTLHSIQLKPGETLYLKTDGYADQFGGPKGKKFRNKNLLEFLMKHQHCSLADQKNMLRQEFFHWKGALEQVDDVCIIGIRC